MTNPYFDTQEGVLLVGEAAIQAHFEAGNMAIVALGSLLVAETFNRSQFDFEKKSIDITAWAEQDGLNYAYWVHNVVKAYDSSANLRQRHLGRMSVLGLGPSEKMLKRTIGVTTVTDLKEKMGIERQFKGHFDELTTEDCYRHAFKIHHSLDRRLSGHDFDQDAKENPGVSPTMYHMRQHASIKQLNESLGHPEVGDWQPEDYLRWGVNFMYANQGLIPTIRFIRTLAAKDRGPWDNNIEDNFTSWMEFKTRVIQRYHNEQLVRLDKLRAYREEAEAGKLPVDIGGLPTEVVLRMGGFNRLINHLVPQLDIQARKTLLLGPPGDEIEQLIEKHPGVSRKHIERLAARNGIFGDIWPMRAKELQRHLKIANPKELTGVKEPDYFDTDETILELVAGRLTPQVPELRVAEPQRISLLGRTIRHKRQLIGKTRPELAKTAFIHPQYLYVLEKGLTKPDKDGHYYRVPSKKVITSLAVALELDAPVLSSLAGHAA